MKAILGVLLCYVFFASQCFAIQGGPGYPGTTGLNVVGTYSAILLPREAEGVNSLGLFTLTIPQTGLANGTVLVFTNGVSYSGTIQGLADPSTAQIYAVINANLLRTVATDSSGDTLVFESLAGGELNGNKIVAVPGFAGTSYRITGDAILQYSSDDPIVTPVQPTQPVDYTVLGFKQS
jgi:hypothetical protein